MGLFAEIFDACSRAVHKRNKAAVSPAANLPRKALRTHITPLVAPECHSGSTPAGLEPEHAIALPPTHDAPLVTHSLPGPVLKMRTCIEHELHTPKSRRRVRMVISGRMADVCAELERLAAMENRMNSSVLH